jgi:hypothetical protein
MADVTMVKGGVSVQSWTKEAIFEGFAFTFSSPGTAELSGGRVRVMRRVMVLEGIRSGNNAYVMVQTDNTSSAMCCSRCSEHQP